MIARIMWSRTAARGSGTTPNGVGTPWNWTCFRDRRLRRGSPAGSGPSDWWLYEPEGVGAALIDHDERRLLWYSHCYGDVAYRAAVLAVMTHIWPGWRIDWAHDGLGEILDALGAQRRTYRPWESPFRADARTPHSSRCDVGTSLGVDARTEAADCRPVAQLEAWAQRAEVVATAAELFDQCGDRIRWPGRPAIRERTSR